jgi:hypothetical protein
VIAANEIAVVSSKEATAVFLMVRSSCLRWRV